LIKEYKLEMPTFEYDPLNQPNVVLVDSTKKQNRCKWREIMKFFYWIGDYQSAMLVNQQMCPLKPLPFKASSFSLYLNSSARRP
jgi:hypothetical protein